MATFTLSLFMVFQSTLPAGEATRRKSGPKPSPNFNPRFPRGKRQGQHLRFLHQYPDFNPRFPRGKRRLQSRYLRRLRPDFNPRFPRGKRLPGGQSDEEINKISIHASRGGSDLPYLFLAVLLIKFQSTLPAGEATITEVKSCGGLLIFQSTLPAGEATVYFNFPENFCTNFNPRFPRGKRL